MLAGADGCTALTYNIQRFYEVFAPCYQSYKGRIALDEFCKQLDNKTGVSLKENA